MVESECFAVGSESAVSDSSPLVNSTGAGWCRFLATFSSFSKFFSFLSGGRFFFFSFLAN